MAFAGSFKAKRCCREASLCRINRAGWCCSRMGRGVDGGALRNQFVARELQSAGLATLLIDLLTEEEEQAERYTRHLRFDIGLLAGRLIGATDWLASEPSTANLSVGYFGASTGGGAALVAAAERRDQVAAVVSRGGRPDLAGVLFRSFWPQRS